MRRTTLALAAALTLSLFAPAAAEDAAAVEAVRALINGADGEARAKAEKLLAADPGAAVRALMEATRTQSLSGLLVAPATMPRDRVNLPLPAEDDEPIVQLHDARDLTGGNLSMERLLAHLRAIVGEREGSSVGLSSNGTIVVVAAASKHEVARAFLDRIRRQDTTLYQIDARLIVAPMTATVGSQVMRSRAGEVVPLEEPAARVAEWVRGGDVTVFASPTVSCLRGETGAMQVGRQMSFVSDFDVEIAQTCFVVDPVIDTVWDGVVAEFSPWPTGEGEIQVTLDVAVCDVEEPFGTFQTSLGGSMGPVTIQIPSYVKTEISRSITMKDGGSALVRLADGPDVRRLVLLTVRVVELAEEPHADDD